jgi:hypothetical protein
MHMKKKDTPPTTAQLLRDRLNRTKPGARGSDAPGKTAASMPNRFTTPASGSTARKSRKGRRPG